MSIKAQSPRRRGRAGAARDAVAVGAKTVEGMPEEVPSISPDAPARDAIRAALISDVRRLLKSEPGALGSDPEGIHQLRTSVRRLRSDLRTFRPLLDHEWASEFAAPLRELADRLGAVRDLDVLRARLAEGSAELPPGASADSLFAALERRQQEERASLLRLLGSDEFHDLRRRLIEASRDPAATPEADTPCREALPPLAAKAWKKLKRAARGLKPGDPEEEFHRVRILTKRARYAAEAVAPALRKRASRAASRFASRAVRVQDVLGLLQDASLARREIDALAAEGGGADEPSKVAAAHLLDAQDQASERARERFRRAWKKLDREELRRWLKP